MNKKGASFSSWTEAIVGTVIFLMIAGGIILFQFTEIYGTPTDTDTSFGLTTNTTLTALTNLQDSMKSVTQNGTATSSSAGISVLDSWALVKGTGSLVWDFVTGGWIEKVIVMMQLPALLGTGLRILYFISIGFIILRILFKVQP